ncbi:membrane bound O-acyl transferase family-domain-containing protein [Cyathus striatus]|nr:membrane bound O-acyl transferase family-domain-containing protein [Cyathus striatus]
MYNVIRVVSYIRLIVDLLRIASLVIRPSPYRSLLFIPILILSLWDIIGLAPETLEENIRLAIGIGCFAGIRIFMASECILIHDVQHDLHRKKDTSRSISNATLNERLKWGLDLFFSPRGVGWTHEPTSRLRWMPPRVISSKSRFIFHQLLRISVFSFLVELYKLYTMQNPCLQRNGPSFHSVPWPWRISILLTRIATYVYLSMIQALLSVIFVGLGISNPQDWPTLYGSWKDAYTVRRFWEFRRTWHQMFRHIFLSHGKFVSGRILGLASSSYLANYVELYTAFIVSGIMHTAGDYRLVGSLQYSGGMKFSSFRRL